MPPSLAEIIPRLCALSAQYLGWRPGEFWVATPAEMALALSDPAQKQGELVSLSDFHDLLERERNG